MHITKSQLKDIIEEEVSEALENRRMLGEDIDKSYVMYHLWSVDIGALMDFVKSYDGMSDEAKRALDDIVRDVDAQCTEETFEEIVDAIGGTNEDIDFFLNTWKQSNVMKGTD